MIECSSPISVPPGSPRWCSWKDLTLCFLIVGVVAFVYWPAKSFGWLNYDDPEYVCANPHVLSGLSLTTFRWAFASQTGGLWQPLTMLSFLLDVRLFGANPAAMHIENVLMHACSAAGWYLLFHGITRRRIASFFIAGIFALHPAHVESVAWITERKDVLSMLMLVLSLLAYWRFSIRSTWSSYLLSLLLFAAALLSKSMMITQPALMLLLDVWPLGRSRFWKPPHSPVEATPCPTTRLLLEKIPFFALSLAIACITFHAQAAAGATPTLVDLSIRDRFATALTGYVRYLGTALWPKDLSVFYPYRFGIPISVVILSILLLALITAVTFRLRHRSPYLAVGWMWYLLAFLPVIGFTQAGSQSIADRFTYLPFVGLSIAMVFTAADFSSHRPFAGISLSIFGAIALLTGTLQTRAYLRCWSDSISLFTHAADVNGSPDWNIEFRLAQGYGAIGRIDLAIEHYDRMLRINPNNLIAQIELANDLMRYSPAMALPHYQQAIRISPNDPLAHYDYAICLQSLGRTDEAKAEFARAKPH